MPEGHHYVQPAKKEEGGPIRTGLLLQKYAPNPKGRSLESRVIPVRHIFRILKNYSGLVTILKPLLRKTVHKKVNKFWQD
jgi:hypothetical protein